MLHVQEHGGISSKLKKQCVSGLMLLPCAFFCAHPGGGKIIGTEIRSMVSRVEMGELI